MGGGVSKLKPPSSRPSCRHALWQESYVIYIKMPEGGRSVPLEVEGSNTIASVKGQLRAMQGMPIGMQRLVFGGSVLDNARALEECDIKPESSLELLYNIGGGGVPRS